MFKIKLGAITDCEVSTCIPIIYAGPQKKWCCVAYLDDLKTI